jgi:hypothetical protein
MLHSQAVLRVRNAVTGLTERPQVSSKVLPSILTLSTVARLATGLVIAALIVIGLTNPGGAQTKELQTERTSSSPFRQKGDVTLHAQCLQDWDAQTHMTKREWSVACPTSVAPTRRLSTQPPEIIQAGWAILRIEM